MIRLINSAIHFTFFNGQGPFFLQAPDTPYDRLHPQTRHICNLLACELHLVAAGAYIAPGFLEITDQGRNPVFGTKAGELL